MHCSSDEGQLWTFPVALEPAVPNLGAPASAQHYEQMLFESSRPRHASVTEPAKKPHQTTCRSKFLQPGCCAPQCLFIASAPQAFKHEAVGIHGKEQEHRDSKEPRQDWDLIPRRWQVGSEAPCWELLNSLFTQRPPAKLCGTHPFRQPRVLRQSWSQRQFLE